MSFSKQDSWDAARDNGGRGISKPQSTLGTNNIQKVVKLRPLVHLFLSVATKLAKRTPLKLNRYFLNCVSGRPCSLRCDEVV